MITEDEKPPHSDILVSLLEQNDPHLVVSEHEWESFFKSTTLSATLLIKLLRFKYKQQHNISVVDKEVVPPTETTDLWKFLGEPLSATNSSQIEYELIILAHKVYKSDPWPVHSLLVRRRPGKEQHNILFTVPVSDISSAFENNWNNDRTYYIKNNEYSLNPSEYYKDNQSLAVFYFLDVLFSGAPYNEDNIQRVYDRNQKQLLNAANYTTTLIGSLTLQHRACAALSVHYKQMNVQLTQVHEIYKKLTKEENETQRALMHMRVEQAKKKFYRLVEREAKLTPNKEKGAIEGDDVLRFNKEDYLSVKSDKMPMLSYRNVQRPSDALFEELLQLLRFVMALGVTRNTTATYKPDADKEDEYTLEQVKTHITHLRYLLLKNVDRHNLHIRRNDNALKTRFDQVDLASFMNDDDVPFLTYDMIAGLLLPDLHRPDILLLGPRDLIRLEQEKEENKKELRRSARRRRAEDVEKGQVEQVIIGDDDESSYTVAKIEKIEEKRNDKNYHEALTKIVTHKRLVFWVIETSKDFSALLIAYRKTNDLPSFVLHVSYYAPRDNATKLEETYKFVRDELLTNVWLKKEASLQLTTLPLNFPRSLHSAYMTFIIGNLQDVSIETFESRALYLRIDDLLNENQPEAFLGLFIWSLKTDIKNIVLQTLLPLPIPVYNPTGEDKKADNRYKIHSRLSDIAKLKLSDEYIDDPILQDMIQLLDLKANCHCFSPLFWTSLLSRKKHMEKNKGSALSHVRKKVFNNPSKDLFLIPINQNSDHWSLGVVDIAMKPTVLYYSSIDGNKDAYYNSHFLPLIKAYLAVQFPGITFEYSRLVGKTQGATSNCALFVLDKISDLGVPLDQRRTYTRETIAMSLQELFLVKNSASSLLSVIAKDVSSRYFDQAEETTEANAYYGIWKSVSDDPEVLLKYRENYLDILIKFLTATQLYEANSLAALKKALISALLCESGEAVDVATLFEQNLLLLPEKKKQQEREKKRSLSVDEENKERRKAQRSANISPFDKVLAEAIQKRKGYNGGEGLFDFLERYSEEILESLKPFIQDVSNLADATQWFIRALFEPDFTEAIAKVLDKFSIGDAYNTKKEEEEDVVKKYMSCFYCNTKTTQVDPLTGRIYCSLDCRIRDKINFS